MSICYNIASCVFDEYFIVVAVSLVVCFSAIHCLERDCVGAEWDLKLCSVSQLANVRPGQVKKYSKQAVCHILHKTGKSQPDDRRTGLRYVQRLAYTRNTKVLYISANTAHIA